MKGAIREESKQNKSKSIKRMQKEWEQGTNKYACPNLVTLLWCCYREKFLWLGVPQQTTMTPKINISQYAIETKCLTLKDQTSYLIPDS